MLFNNKVCDSKQRFSIRKLSIGVCSVLLATLFMGTASVQTVHADPENINSENIEQVEEQTSSTTSADEALPTQKDEVDVPAEDTPTVKIEEVEKPAENPEETEALNTTEESEMDEDETAHAFSEEKTEQKQDEPKEDSNKENTDKQEAAKSKTDSEDEKAKAPANDPNTVTDYGNQIDPKKYSVTLGVSGLAYEIPPYELVDGDLRFATEEELSHIKGWSQPAYENGKPKDVGTYLVFISQTGYDNILHWLNGEEVDGKWTPRSDVENIVLPPYNLQTIVGIGFGVGFYHITPAPTGGGDKGHYETETEPTADNLDLSKFAPDITPENEKLLPEVSEILKDFAFEKGDLEPVKSDTEDTYNVVLTDQGVKHLQEVLGGNYKVEKNDKVGTILVKKVTPLVVPDDGDNTPEQTPNPEPSDDVEIPSHVTNPPKDDAPDFDEKEEVEDEKTDDVDEVLDEETPKQENDNSPLAEGEDNGKKSTNTVSALGTVVEGAKFDPEKTAQTAKATTENTESEDETLPETGERNSSAMIILGGLAAILGLGSLAINRKKVHK